MLYLAGQGMPIMTVPTYEDARAAAAFLAAAGLRPRDIAKHLAVNERQVRDWLDLERSRDRPDQGATASRRVADERRSQG